MEDDAPAPEDARMTLTLTNGQSVGVQSDQVTELGPETITLSLPDHNVMHTAWNPRDPAVLATAGHALCRIWSVRPSHNSHDSHDSHNSHTPKSPTTSLADSHNARNPINPINSHQFNQPNLPHHSDHPDHLIDSNTNNNTLHPPHSAKDLPYVDILDPSDEASLVTTMAWRPDGDVLAVATRNTVSDWTGVVSLWSKSGKSIDELPSAQDMVLIFRWSQSGTYLLGITSSGRDSSALVIWNTRSSQALPPLQIDGVVTDAAWTGDRRLTVCGHGIITEVVIEGESLVIVDNRGDTENTERWTNIQYDTATKTTAVAAEESGMLGILHASSHLRTTVAHDAEITALAFQPILDPSSYLPTSPRLLITSSLDGTVKVWDAKNPFSNIHILGLGRSTPAMAISFTPDGDLVAAANWGRILIWNAETGGMPKASWNGDQGRWQSLANGVDQDSGIGEEEDGLTHSLSWDADGRKLAYGLGSQVNVAFF